MNDARASWNPGDVVHQYLLLARIATGGMAEIWLARQAGLKGFEKLVVIKRMVDALCEDPEFVEMFLDEARIAAQLNHPNIVQIYDLGEKQGAYFIAMEYLAGENLSVIIREGIKQQKPLPFTLAAQIIVAAAEALGHAHQQVGLNGEPLGVVHRDVSPQNILVSYDGQTKVLDFGIAKATSRGNITVGHKLKGKLSYMSPEHVRGQDVDGRSDQFALGIVLHELVTRTRLFKPEDAVHAVRMIGGKQEIPTAASRNPDVPLELSDIIARALSRRPDDRYPSCRDFAHALELWLKTQSAVPGPHQLAAYMSMLFGQRMAQRVKLLEQARVGELTPGARSRLRSASQYQTESNPQAPVTPAPSSPATAAPQATPHFEDEPAPARRWPRFAALAVVCLLVGAAGLSWLGARSTPAAAAPTPAAAATPTVVRIETEPAGAHLTVDGVPQGDSPLTVRSPLPGPHEVVAEAEGRAPATRRFTVHEGERQTILLQLAPLVPIAPAPVVPADVPERRVAQARGRLTLNTEPWTQVYLGSRLLGETPILDVSMPAGRHVLQLVNKDKRISSSVSVEIRPGQDTRMKLKL